MKINRLASVICRGSWLLDPRIADGFLPSVARYLNGERVSFFDEDGEAGIDAELLPFCMSDDGTIIASNYGKEGGVFKDTPRGSIAVIPIKGTIMQEDYCGAVGTKTLSTWTKEAYASENIIALIYVINSGGGSVDGTGDFAEVISQANKPVIAYTDGLMASAAYWIGSATHEIFASYETVEIGSIGTAISFNDNREAMAKYGYKQHYINSDGSPDKNQDYFQALDGNYKPIKTNILNPTNDVFLNAVKINRAGKLVLTDVQHEDGNTYQEPLTGKVYLAKKAIELGLIDKIGSFDIAFSRAQELASNPQLLKKNKQMITINKFKSLTNLKGKKAEEVTAEDVKAVNEEIETENIMGVTLSLDSELQALAAHGENSDTSVSALKSANEQITQLNADLQTANDAKATAEATLVTMSTDRDSWKAKAIEYGAKSADESTSGKKEGTDEIPGTTATVYMSEADAELKKIKAERKSLPSTKK